VDSVGGVPASPQSWRRYSYARGNPLKYLDHDGREVRLANDASPSLSAIQLMVPPEVRSAITTRQDTLGREVVAIKGETDSEDINFQNLQKAVNSPGIVQINEADDLADIPYMMHGNEQDSSLFRMDTRGVTLPTSGTAGDGPITSTTPGVMQMYIDSGLSAGDQAPVIAAELAGHVIPGLLGQGASVPNVVEHHRREDPARAAAKRNREHRDRHSESGAMRIIGVFFVCISFLNVAGASPRAVGAPDTLILTSESSFSSRVLSIDFGSRGVAEVRTCEDIGVSGLCKSPWKISQRRLSAKEVQEFSRLTQEAKLFEGRSTGGHIDWAFRWLEVRSRNEIAMLVVTLNSSFSEPDARKRLFEKLAFLEDQLSPDYGKH